VGYMEFDHSSEYKRALFSVPFDIKEHPPWCSSRSLAIPLARLPKDICQLYDGIPGEGIRGRSDE
jgi:hypothetical protein